MTATLSNLYVSIFPVIPVPSRSPYIVTYIIYFGLNWENNFLIAAGNIVKKYEQIPVKFPSLF